MENCLFDRIGKRKEVETFLKDKSKQTLLIRYDDSEDGSEHFIEWLKGFVSTGKSFNPVHIKAETAFLNPDPYSLLDEALSSFKEFDNFRKSYNSLKYDKAKAIEKETKKDVINLKSNKKTGSNISNTLIRIFTKRHLLSAEQSNEIRTHFFDDLRKVPNLLFIIHINAKWKNSIHDVFKELIPQDNSLISKFIFVLRHKSDVNVHLSLGTIQNNHIEQYLRSNKSKLKLEDEQIQNFTNYFKEPSKYATVRSKAVKEFKFNELTDCNKTTKL